MFAWCKVRIQAVCVILENLKLVSMLAKTDIAYRLLELSDKEYEINQRVGCLAISTQMVWLETCRIALLLEWRERKNNVNICK